MATYTDNYNLIKPTYAETADIVPLNNNFEKIDNVMHSNQISLAPAYDQTKEYATGDTVMYELLMYKCTAPTTGVWDPSKWERTTASESGGGGSAELDILGEGNGAIVSFSDGASAELAKCIAEIVPKQAGSGTPSPNNVRAISGYTAVKVDVAGKNLCRVNTGNNVVVAHCKAGQTYTFSIRNQGNCGFNLKKNTTEGEQIVRQAPSTDAVLYQTFTADEDFDLFLNGFGSGGASFGSSAYDYQLELGSDATTYEAYAGSTYTTPLGQTVYGGQLNVLTGELTIEHVQYVFDGSEQIVAQNVGWGTNVLDNTIKPNINNNTMSDILCDIFSPETPSHVWNHTSDNIIGIAIESDNYKIRFYSSAFVGKTSSEVATEMTGHMLVYPLAIPQTVQLTPQEVNSLLGQNNISADTGDVDIVYVKASAPIQPNPTGEPTATLKKLGIEGTVFEVPSGGGGSSAINYSTTEQKTGRKWLDGKDIYERTYTGSFIVPSGGTWYNTGISLSDVENLIDTQSRQSIAKWNFISGLNNSGTLVLINPTGGSLTVDSITIQYTKITD